MLPLPLNKTGPNILLAVWELGPDILTLVMELGLNLNSARYLVNTPAKVGKNRHVLGRSLGAFQP